MAPSIIYNDAAQGEVSLPGQIFVFGGVALQANSLGHMEQIDSYAPGHQVRFGSLNYTAVIRGDLIFDRFEPMVGTLNGHDGHDFDLPLGQCSGDHTCGNFGPQSGADRAFRGRVDGPCHRGRAFIGVGAEH